MKSKGTVKTVWAYIFLMQYKYIEVIIDKKFILNSLHSYEWKLEPTAKKTILPVVFVCTKGFNLIRTKYDPLCCLRNENEMKWK